MFHNEILHKNREKLFPICPATLPPGQGRFKQFHDPGPEELVLSLGFPGGKVTGQVEPCIDFCFLTLAKQLRNGKRAACNYRVMDARGRLLSTKEE